MIKLIRDERRQVSEHDRARPIVEIMQHAGYEISLADAYWAWEHYSESMAAGWMMLFEDERQTVDVVLYRMNVQP